MRPGRHDAAGAQAADLQQQGRRSLRQSATFVYIAEDDEYRCPAGQRAIKRFTTIEHGMTLHKYWSSACPSCPLKAQCTTERLSAHHALGARGRARGDAGAPGPQPEASTNTPANRRTSLRHAQSLDGRDALPDQDAAAGQYRDELHVLAYNLKRVMQIMGIRPLMQAMRA